MDTSLTKRNTTDLAENGFVKKSPLQSSLVKPCQKLTLDKINPLLQCKLCNGYLIDATKMTCNHNFCRACIWKFYENGKANCQCKLTCKCILCPVKDCKKVISKLNPDLKPDTTLQDIVYKLVPGLYQNEMQRRRKFYETNQEPNKLNPEDRGEIPDNKVFYTVNDKISLSLEYGLGENQVAPCEFTSATSSNDSSKNGHLTSTENSNSSGSFKNIEQEATASRRYLLAPAGFPIRLLKKFVLCKWDLPNSKYRAQIFYLNEELDDELNLMDIAYINSWKRMAPLRLFYRFIPRQPKANKLNKIRVNQISSVTNLPSTSKEQSAHTNQQQLNNQISHQANHVQPNLPPAAKKSKLESSLSKPIPSRSTQTVQQNHQQNHQNQQQNQHQNQQQNQHQNQPQNQHQNRNSPLQPTIRNSPVQSNLTRASPLNNNSPARSSPNQSNSVNKSSSMATSSTLQQMYNVHLNQQTKVTSSPNTAFTATNQNKMNPNSLKRTNSKTKLNSQPSQHAFSQMNNSEFEPSSKYRKILPANGAFVSNQQKASSFAQPVATMSNQLNALNKLSNYHQQQQQQHKQNLNNARNQFNQQNPTKMTNVNHMNSTLNTNAINALNINSLNAINNLSNFNNSFRNVANLLNGNVASTISSSSTVTSLRNVRVPNTEKKKIQQQSSTSSINSSSLSSQTKSNLVANKYNLPLSTGIPAVSKNNTNSPPKNSFNISSILEGSSSSFNKKDESKPTQLLASNASSLSSLNQLQSALEHVNNLKNLNNHHLTNSNLPLLSPTSSSGHKRKSFDKSPNAVAELGSSVTAKGIKIFRNGLASPTGSNSSNSLNNSLNSLNGSLNSPIASQTNKSSLNDKNLQVKYDKSNSAQSNEQKSPIVNLKQTAEKSPPSNLSSQFKQQQIKLTEQQKPEETKKQSPTTVKMTTMNSSMNSLNAVNNVSNSQIATLEAVGLSSKVAVNSHSKKGASLDKIVNKITSNIIGKNANTERLTNGLSNGSTNLLNKNNSNQTKTTNSNSTQSNGISFAQAVYNGLKNEAEQKSTKDNTTNSINSNTNRSSPKQVTESLTIRLPLLNNLEAAKQETKSPTNKETVSKSLFSNSKIEVTIEEDESPKEEETIIKDEIKKPTSAEQVFSDVEVDDDDDSMDGKLVMVIPETENSCSSSAEDKLATNKSSSNQQTILKQQNQSLNAIQANTPPSSSPDFSKKFSSSRSNSPISSNGGDKLTITNSTTTNSDENLKAKQPLTADPVSPPLTPSPRLCETSNRENNFGALDLSTGPRKPINGITIPTPKLTESV